MTSAIICDITDSNMKKRVQLLDISNWEYVPEAVGKYPVYQCPDKVRYMVKPSADKFLSIKEMFVSKLCSEAQFDAVENHMSIDERKSIGKQATIISKLLDNKLMPLSETVTVGTNGGSEYLSECNIGKFFELNSAKLDNNFKQRFIEEYLFRMIVKDTDASTRRNVSMLKNISPITLSKSYDFDRCLEGTFTADEKLTRLNLNFIKKNFPKNAEKVFSQFSFDNATIDDIFGYDENTKKWIDKWLYHYHDYEQRGLYLFEIESQDKKETFTGSLESLKNEYSRL